MAIPKLAERLKAEFGGRVEVEWGIPEDENLNATLTDVRKKPKAEAINKILIRYFGDYGFSHMQDLQEAPLAFEHSQHGHRCTCYTYNQQLERLIVTATKF